MNSAENAMFAGNHRRRLISILAVMIALALTREKQTRSLCVRSLAWRGYRGGGSSVES